MPVPRTTRFANISVMIFNIKNYSPIVEMGYKTGIGSEDGDLSASKPDGKSCMSCNCSERSYMIYHNFFYFFYTEKIVSFMRDQNWNDPVRMLINFLVSINQCHIPMSCLSQRAVNNAGSK